MDISQLEVLVAVAGEHGFSRAAARLHRTQPAVSQAIQRLEQDAGMPLIDRSSKGAALTAAGHVLHDFALQMLNLRRDARTALQELSDLSRGKVSVAANEYTVTHLLPALGEFHRLHPQVRIEVRRSLASRIPSEVLARDVEVGVVTYRPTNPGLSVVPFAVDDLVLLLAPTHPLAGRAVVSVRDLGTESFLAHDVRSPNRDFAVLTFARHRTPLNIVMELPTLEAIKRLVVDGLGVALMPRRAAEVEIERGTLVAVAIREMRVKRAIQIVHRRGASLSHAAAAFVACATSGAGRPTPARRAAV